MAQRYQPSPLEPTPMLEQHSRVTFINGLEADPLFPPNITKESNPWVKLLPISDFLVQRAYDTEIRLRCDFAALPLDCQSLILGMFPPSTIRLSVSPCA